MCSSDLSGIGGLHLALKRVNANASILSAFDWDSLAAQVYAENHPATPVLRTDISLLTAEYLRSFSVDAWLLSPSCQPYTTLNPNAQGASDPRAKSFLHLVENVLPALHSTEHHPKYMFIENVAGFETSSTRQMLLKVLESLGYSYQELLITPVQFGIPNMRRRYYLLARSSTLLPFPTHVEGVLDYVPGRCQPWRDDYSAVKEIKSYLDPEDAYDYETYEIARKTLHTWGRLFDITLPSRKHTNCFIRGYTRRVEGAGSILQLNEDLNTTEVFDAFLEAKEQGSTDAVRLLDPLRLRYFTPSELLRLFAFTDPRRDEEQFVWPASVSTKVKYRLIGNSVNVKVVSELISYLLHVPPPPS